jgi:hypothetical protein
MDHNDKRNTNVPLGTFGETTPLDPDERTPTLFGSSDRTSTPIRQRVPTLLGVPIIQVNAQRQAAADSTSPRERKREPRTATDNLASAFSEMLDEQLSIAVEIDDDSDDLALVSDKDMIELPDAVPDPEQDLDDRPTTVAPMPEAPTTPRMAAISARPDDYQAAHQASYDPAYDPEDRPTTVVPKPEPALATGRLPLLIPTQYAEAQTRDRADQVLATAAAVTAANQPLSAAETSRAFNTTSTTSTHLNPNLSYAAATLPPPAADPPLTITSLPPMAASLPPHNVSSLAPREVARLKPAERSDANPGIGAFVLAAMALIAVGGWWYTAGSFNRSEVSQAPAPLQPQATSQPLATLPQPISRPAPLVSAPAQPEASSTPVVEAPAENGLAPKSTSAGKGKALAIGGRALHSKAAPKPLTGDIPQTPSRTDVLHKLEAVRPSVRACAAGRSGVADLDITVAHSGVVTHVLVGGDFAGTTQGTCIARAVREARFDSFKQERFRLLFPYAI